MISAFLNNSAEIPDRIKTTSHKTNIIDRKVIKHNLQAITKKQDVGTIQSLLNSSSGTSNIVPTVKTIPFHPISHLSDQSSIKTNTVHQTPTNRIPISTSEVSYRGLKNLGATCYMNSILQVLFHLPLFRKYIFNIRVGDTEEDHNILLHLQRIFAMMQLSHYSVSTKNLARSFGWSNIETMMQQDVYEFCSVFLEKIDITIQKIPQNKKFSISSLFKGKYISTIRCRHVNFQTQTTNVINVCTLDVRGVSSLEESFLSFTSVEPLDGSNKYDTGTYGLQDADMFSKFTELPQILMLHLKRFDIDMETQQNSKIDSYFSFSKNIDLRKYLADQNNVDCSQYELFGVLVHAGTINSGHYTAFIRPTPNSPWHCFNDSEVNVVDEEKAIYENFGGPDLQTKKNKLHCAYMLIYIRIDSIDRIFSPVSDDEIPEPLKKFVKDNDQQIKLKKQIKEDENQRVIAHIIQVQDLEYLAEKTGRILFESSMTIDVKKSMTFDNIYDIVAVFLETHPIYLTIWLVHQNSLQFKLNKSLGKVEDVMNFAFDENNIKLFVEIDENESPNRSISQNKSHTDINSLSKSNQAQTSEIVIFVYSYFPSQRRPFRFTSTVSIQLDENVSDLFESVRDSYNIPHDVEMHCYIANNGGNTDLNPNRTPLIFIDNPEKTIGSLGLVDGSMIIIQPDPYQFIPEEGLGQHLEKTSTEAKVVKEDQAYSFIPDFMQAPPIDVSTYFEYLNNNRYIAVNTMKDPDAHVYLRFPETISVSMFKQFIADAFGIRYNENKDIMALYWKNSPIPIIPNIQSNDNINNNSSPNHNNPTSSKNINNNNLINHKSAIDKEENMKIGSILDPEINGIMVHIFKNTPIQTITSIRRIIAYIITQEGLMHTSLLLLNGNSNVANLLDIIKRNSSEFKMNQSIRVLQYKKGRSISMPLPPYMPISELRNPIRIEIIPKEQIDMPKKSFLMQVFQVKPGTKKPVDYLAPFLVFVRREDTFSAVKQRMKKYLRQRKIKDSKSRYFVCIGDNTIYLTDDFLMKQLISVNTPIYIEEIQKFSGNNERNGVKIYT
ncbi:hypothetical protein M9Y10_009805 [Tritrichomonas musculus]|uniref:ubiquitinyl hydrolase 1 n=1 Tax=Tritrichomonas musculus TaxID=1915356 RepID=A0ABR2IPF4_9EUKA